MELPCQGSADNPGPSQIITGTVSKKAVLPSAVIPKVGKNLHKDFILFQSRTRNLLAMKKKKKIVPVLSGFLHKAKICLELTERAYTT